MIDHSQYYFICEPNRTNGLLTQSLSDALGKTIIMVDFKFIASYNFERPNVIALIDATRLPLLSNLNQHFSTLAQRPTCVFVNMGEHQPMEEMLQWPKLKGSFALNTSAADIATGLTAIADGENWLTRTIMAELIEHYQNRLSVYNPTYHINLTSRELDVLQSLKQGQSNNVIADDLFISENTIKSHLYNIFRKIEVKNRTQAILWAKQYLP